MEIINWNVKYEYTQIQLDSNKPYINTLNEYGKDGWELVQIVNTLAGIFAVLKKRFIEKDV